MRKLIVYILLWVLGGYTVYAFDFRYLRPYEGMKDSEINFIHQDSDGYMWFATWSGLICYDGFSFQHFRPELGNPNSLPSKKIRIVFEDSRENLWIASNRTLSVFNKTKKSFHTYEFERVNADYIYILQLYELQDKLIIHAADGFYFIPLSAELDVGNKIRTIEIRSADPSASIYFQFSMPVGERIYFSSNNTISNTSEIFIGEYSDYDGVPHFFIRKLTDADSWVNRMIYVEQENTIYLATRNGVFPYSLNQDKYIKKTFFPDMEITNMIYTSDNRIYCVSNNPVLYYIDIHTGNTGSFPANPNRLGSLLNSNILSLFEDFSGNLWIGHQGQGISILNLHRKEFDTYRHEPSDGKSLISNTIMCFNGNNEDILIGCRVGGINILPKNRKLAENEGFRRAMLISPEGAVPFVHGVWDIAKITDDLFLVGSFEGVYELEKVFDKWEVRLFSDQELFSQSCRKIFVDENKNVWFGFLNQGLVFVPNLPVNGDRIYYQYRYDENNKNSLSDNELISMLVDGKGRFWIGTVNGLNLVSMEYHNLDLSGKVHPEIHFRRFASEHLETNFLNNNEINCIFENYNGQLWIATQGGGINIFDPASSSFTYLTQEQGLPSNDVQGILRDETGTLWISTNNGLVSYNQHVSDPKFHLYSFQDGLQGSIFMVNSFFKSMDGEMFFGGDNGFTRFYPRNIHPNTIPPKMVFTDMKIYNRLIGIGDTIYKQYVLEKCLNETSSIQLPFRDRVFSIGVSSIHYQYPLGNYISYTLEGYDKEWNVIPASSKFIEYSNLPFGDYTLKAIAYSSDNIPSDETRELQIVIDPPWYLRWYVIVVFSLIGLAVLVGFIFILVNRQKLSYQKKIDDLSMEANESKMMFLTNIAHGLRTPLSLVIGPVEDMIQNYNDVNPKWRNHLYLIHRNSNYLLKLINQIIDFRKLNAGKLTLYRQNTDIARLVKEVAVNFKGMEGKRKIHLEFDLPDQPLIISVDTQKIEEVLYNLLSNAFKHTPKDHTIKISLNRFIRDEKNEMVRISIFNEGSQIEEKDRLRIFERFYKTDESIEGAGIGLSFSRSLVEMHHGAIEVDSIPGKGVVFHISLPFEQLKSGEIAQELSPGSERELLYPVDETGSEIPEEEDEKNLKILLVEDNEDLRSFLVNVLSREYSCFEAGNGEEGLEMVKEIMPDIVISDIIMPVMDGYEFCRLLKEIPGTCHIPVILLTAKDTSDQIKSGYQVGADAYVTKPFDLGIISAQISRLIKNRELIRKKYIDQNFMVEVNRSSLSKDDEFIMNIRKLLETNLSDSEYNVKEMASSLNVSTTQLYRKIKALTGYSPVEFIRIVKLQKAYEMLVERHKSVKEVCYLAGFNNVSYFIKCFKEQFGVTPANLRDLGGIEEQIPDNTKQSKI